MSEGEKEGRFWLHTLGCPKNQVDSDKLAGRLGAEGYRPAGRPEEADLVVVNTCAFIEEARQESIDTVLELAGARRPGARLVVTGCLAERYGQELAEALPEVDRVAGFGQPVAPPPTPIALGRRDEPAPSPAAATFDLLELPRPPASAPWAYVKVAEGCDRICGFCAIPSFRGRQRSRPPAAVLGEVERLAGSGGGVQEVVLVAQDLASYGRDRRGGSPGVGGVSQPIVDLTQQVAARVPRVRLLYLYPSGLSDQLVETILSTGVPYFDLSLQHASRRLLAAMRRWGDGERFLRRLERIRRLEPTATFRSSFILGYPGETEDDHDRLLAFLEEAQLDWAGFFPYSREAGTHAAGLPQPVAPELALERLRECTELQDGITARRRDRLVGQVHTVLVDAPGTGRTVHEAPEIDGVVHLPASLGVGQLVPVQVMASLGTDLVGVPG